MANSYAAPHHPVIPPLVVENAQLKAEIERLRRENGALQGEVKHWQDKYLLSGIEG